MRIIRPSAMSPCGVDVACALMWTMSEALISASWEGARSFVPAPRPAGSGWAMSWASAVTGAEHLGVMVHRGPLRASTRARTPALSRQAVAGEVPRPTTSCRVAVFFDSAIMFANAAIGSGWIAASVPPARRCRPGQADLVEPRDASLPERRPRPGC